MEVFLRCIGRAEKYCFERFEFNKEKRGKREDASLYGGISMDDNKRANTFCPLADVCRRHMKPQVEKPTDHKFKLSGPPEVPISIILK